MVDTITSPFMVGSNSLMGLIKLDANTLVASTFNSGTYRSTDDGATWAESQDDTELGNASYAHFALARNGTLFLGGASLELSTDEGDTWGSGCFTSPFIGEVETSPSGVMYLIAGPVGFLTLYESVDDGQTWMEINEAPFSASSIREMAVGGTYVYVIGSDNHLVSQRDFLPMQAKGGARILRLPYLYGAYGCMRIMQVVA